MRKFLIEQKPYDDILYKQNEVEFNEGVTVLVGCNGVGKTTLIHIIKEKLNKKGIPFYTYNNLTEGGNFAMQKALNSGNTKVTALLATSSEGEQIIRNLGNIAYQIGRFIKENSSKKELWMFFDAIDSGLSLDNIIEIKDFFSFILKEKGKNTDIYIVCSANAYEMCCDVPCFDVYNGEYIRIDSYDNYKKFILESRKTKEKRYE